MDPNKPPDIEELLRQQQQMQQQMLPSAPQLPAELNRMLQDLTDKLFGAAGVPGQDQKDPVVDQLVAQTQSLLGKQTNKLRHIHGCTERHCPAGYYVDNYNNRYPNSDFGESDGKEIPDP